MNKDVKRTALEEMAFRYWDERMSRDWIDYMTDWSREAIIRDRSRLPKELREP